MSPGLIARSTPEALASIWAAIPVQLVGAGGSTANARSDLNDGFQLLQGRENQVRGVYERRVFCSLGGFPTLSTLHGAFSSTL